MLTVQQIKDTVTDYFKDKPVKEIYLYGSYARGEAEIDSDVDLMVEYENSRKLSLHEIWSYTSSLEELFNHKVDLVEERLMYPRIRKNIEGDKVLIFSKDEDKVININISEPKKSLKSKQKKDNIVYLELIDSGIKKIIEFTKNVNEIDFLENSLIKDACMGVLMVIGVNAEKLPQQIKEGFTATEWESMTVQEKFFDCEEFYADWKQLWNIIYVTLPSLRPKIENIIATLEKENNAKTN